MMTHTVNSSVEDSPHQQPQPQPQPSSAALFSLLPLALNVVVSSPTQEKGKLKAASSSDVSKCIVANSRQLGFEEKKSITESDVVPSCGIQEDVDVLARKISNLGSQIEKCKNIELGSASGEVINQVKIEEQGKCKVKSEMGVRHGRETNSFLESKKKNLSTARSIFQYGNAEKFTDCESSFVHNDSCIGINKLVNIKMDIIDDTALIDSVMFPPTHDTCNGKRQGDAKKPRSSRKMAKDVKNVSQLMISDRQSKMMNYTASVVPRNDGNGKKRLYSREEMEGLRLANLAEQRQMWRDIYTGLPPSVVKEYIELAIPKGQNNIGLNFDPRSRYRYVRKTEPSVIPSVIAAN